jgi:hypothetical protein
VDQLEQLHRELDVPDPPAAALHRGGVLPAGPDVLLDPHLHGPHVIDGGRFQVLRVHDGFEVRDHRLTQLQLAGDRPGLQPCLPLPGGRVPPVILDGCGEGSRQRAAAPLRTKVGIDAEGDAFLGRTRQELHDARRSPGAVALGV